VTGRTPVLHVIAGPNGAGKSTFADRVLLPELRGIPFVNADLIQRAAAEGGTTIDSYAASRQGAAIRDRLIQGHRSFVFETVFSHPSKVALLTAARDVGYLISLHVMVIPVELAVVRVKLRAAQGGHPVPEDKIRERHARLWVLIAEAASHADETIIYDSTATPKVIARLRGGLLIGVPDWPSWTPAELSALS
jgi:predicted ABC-type ATPase